MKRVALLVLAIFAVTAATAGAAQLITSSQIKNGTIKTADISSSAKRALKGNRGPRGFTGARGATGAQGPAGPSALGGVTVVRSPQVAFGPSDTVIAAAAVCPTGQRVISGGGVSISDEQLASSSPSDDRTSWFVIGVDNIDNGGEYVQATALCAPAGVAVAASRRSAKAQLADLVAKTKAQLKAAQ